MFFIIFLATASVFIWMLQRSLKNKRLESEYRKRNIPFQPVTDVVMNFFLGNRAELELYSVIQKYGNKIFGINVFEQNVTVVIAEPELVQQVLSKEFTNFVNRRKNTLKDPIFSKILFFLEDEAWKRIRSIVAPTFSAKKLRRMIPQIEETTSTLLKNLGKAVEKETAVNIKPLTGAFTMDTIVKTAFGVKIDSLDNVDNPLVNSAREIFAPEFSFFQKLRQTFFLYFPMIRELRNKFNISHPNKVFEKYSKMIIDEKRKKFAANSTMKAVDFIELLLEAEMNGHQDEQSTSNGQQDDDNESHEIGGTKIKKYITEDEMVAQCVLFFFAGYDTTATTLTMSLYNLALHQDKQEKLYQEICRLQNEVGNIKDDQNSDDIKDGLTTEKLAKYEYLEAVINETLRLYPVVSSIERRAAVDIHLETDDGKHRLHLKKDDVVRIPIYSLHHDPDQWEKPFEFKPERFLQGNSKHHKYSYIPFGSGPRICVGRALGLTEAKIALMNIVQRYKLDVCNQTTIPAKFSNRTGLLSPFKILLKIQQR